MSHYINNGDLRKWFKDHDVPILVFNSGRWGMGGPEGWCLLKGDMYHGLKVVEWSGKHNPNLRFGMRRNGEKLSREDWRQIEMKHGSFSRDRESDFSQLGLTYKTGHKDFQDAVKSSGVTEWVRLQPSKFDQVWFPKGSELPPELKKTKVVTGAPCPATGISNFERTYCHRLVDESREYGLCKMHSNGRDKRSDNAAARAAENEERRKKREHAEQVARAAQESLDEIRPLLVQMGHHPDLFEADRYGIHGPAENVRELVRLAALAYELFL